VSASGIVALAAAAGELATVDEIDRELAGMYSAGHRDQTWRELVDALLDLRRLRVLETPMA
jgi:hypothetical protein